MVGTGATAMPARFPRPPCFSTIRGPPSAPTPRPSAKVQGRPPCASPRRAAASVALSNVNSVATLSAHRPTPTPARQGLWYKTAARAGLRYHNSRGGVLHLEYPLCFLYLRGSVWFIGACVSCSLWLWRSCWVCSLRWTEFCRVCGWRRRRWAWCPCRCRGWVRPSSLR